MRELHAAEYSNLKKLEAPPSQSPLKLTNVRKFNSLEIPPSPRLWGSTSTVQIEDDSLKKLSDLNVSDNKGKSKRFFNKIFSSKDSGWRKGGKKKTAVLEQ